MSATDVKGETCVRIQPSSLRRVNEGGGLGYIARRERRARASTQNRARPIGARLRIPETGRRARRARARRQAPRDRPALSKDRMGLSRFSFRNDRHRASPANPEARVCACVRVRVMTREVAECAFDRKPRSLAFRERTRRRSLFLLAGAAREGPLRRPDDARLGGLAQLGGQTVARVLDAQEPERVLVPKRAA